MTIITSVLEVKVHPLFLFGAHLSTTWTATMDMDDFYEFLTIHYALLAAVVVGLFGILFALCFFRKPGYVKSQREGKLEQSVGEESAREQEEDSGQKHQKQQTKVRGVKPKAVRKITLPSHPLLAGEFKGHTGAVLSLDFDINGKYLASCSEGATTQVTLANYNFSFIDYPFPLIDRTLRLWHMKTLQEKDHKYFVASVNSILAMKLLTIALHF